MSGMLAHGPLHISSYNYSIRTFFIYFEQLDYLWEMNGLFVFAWVTPYMLLQLFYSYFFYLLRAVGLSVGNEWTVYVRLGHSIYPLTTILFMKN